jgi:hypothetical protein
MAATTDTVFAAAATASLHAANADTASAANVTFAAGVQDAPIVPAPAIACAVATPRRSRSHVKNVATNRYLKKAAVLDGMVQAWVGQKLLKSNILRVFS